MTDEAGRAGPGSRRRPAARRTGVPVVAALLLPVTSACSDVGGETGRPAVVRDSAGIAVVENGPPEDVPLLGPSGPTLSIGAVDAEGPEQLYRVSGATALPGGGVAVVNSGSGEVRLFDEAGAFLRAVGGEGEGPGEFHAAAGVRLVGGDSMAVWDGRLRRLTVFGPAGGVGRIARAGGSPLNPDMVAVLSDGGFILSDLRLDIPPSGFAPMAMPVVRYDAGGSPADTLPEEVAAEMGMLDRELGMVGGPLFGARTSLAGDTAGYWVGTARGHELRRHAATGRLLRIVRWEGPDRRVDEADARAEMERRLEGRTGDDLERVRRLYDDRPTADLFPAYDLVLPGRDGGVLVRSFHRPRRETRPPWLVFDRDGRLEARLELPESFHPFQLGDGWVLGVERDGMDVEYVRRYDLEEVRETGGPGEDDRPG